MKRQRHLIVFSKLPGAAPFLTAVLGLPLWLGSLSAQELRVHGVAVGPDGGRLAGLELRLFDRAAPDFTAERLLGATTTDAEGRSN